MAITFIKLEKFTTESKYFTFDFSGETEIAGGDTIASFLSLVAYPPTGLTLGIPALSGTSKVLVKISDGVGDVLYTLYCTVQTTGGSILTLEGDLFISKPKV